MWFCLQYCHYTFGVENVGVSLVGKCVKKSASMLGADAQRCKSVLSQTVSAGTFGYPLIAGFY